MTDQELGRLGSVLIGAGFTAASVTATGWLGMQDDVTMPVFVGFLLGVVLSLVLLAGTLGRMLAGMGKATYDVPVLTEEVPPRSADLRIRWSEAGVWFYWDSDLVAFRVVEHNGEWLQHYPGSSTPYVRGREELAAEISGSEYDGRIRPAADMQTHWVRNRLMSRVYAYGGAVR